MSNQPNQVSDAPHVDLLTHACTLVPCRMVVANATTPLVLESVRDATELGLVEPILVGSGISIERAADAIEWDVSDCAIEFAGDEAQAARIAVALAASGQAAAITKGHIHTDVLMRAVVDRHAGLRTDRLMSHVFHMTVPSSNRQICITDAVINILPSVDQKMQIASNAVSLLRALDYDSPRIAMLSASETENPSMPSTLDAAEIARRAKQGALPGAFVEGPLALDLAISRSAAELKGVDNAVVGRADVLLVPNIETGNALFKLMVHFMDAIAAGVVLGAKVPVVLTSRADSAASRLASTALAAIYASHKVEEPKNETGTRS